MNTVIKFLLYLLVLLLLVSWLITVGKSCNNKKENAALEQMRDQNLAEEETAQDLMEDLEEESDFSEELEDILDEEEDGLESNEIDYSQYDESNTNKEEASKPQNNKTSIEIENKSKPQIKETKEEASSALPEQPVKTREAPSATKKARYMVVAGSYIMPSNAQLMQKRLAKLGYQSEVVNFDLSQYHSVLAGRYDDLGSANQTVKNLANKGIDAYAKRRSK